MLCGASFRLAIMARRPPGGNSLNVGAIDIVPAAKAGPPMDDDPAIGAPRAAGAARPVTRRR